jgi:hypothetical protein
MVTFKNLNMASNSNSILFDIQSAKRICLIVGLVCLSGFCLDMLTLGLPPNLLSSGWRINFLRQLGDRSITLMFGVAFTMWGIHGNRRLRKQLALFCLISAILMLLCSILVIYDSQELKVQSLANIDNQATKLKNEIDAGRNNPEILGKNISPELIDQASRNVGIQAEGLKEKAINQLTKATILNLGNLIIIGLGLIALGRWGLSV